MSFKEDSKDQISCSAQENEEQEASCSMQEEKSEKDLEEEKFEKDLEEEKSEKDPEKHEACQSTKEEKNFQSQENSGEQGAYQSAQEEEKVQSKEDTEEEESNQDNSSLMDNIFKAECFTEQIVTMLRSPLGKHASSFSSFQLGENNQVGIARKKGHQIMKEGWNKSSKVPSDCYNNKKLHNSVSRKK